MIDEQTLAEAAYFDDQPDRELTHVREDVTSEWLVDGEVQEIAGVEYHIAPPCNVSDALRAIEEDSNTVMLDASLNNRGVLCVFCPYRTERAGQLFHTMSKHDRP